jgi:DNA-binding Xre family transcriptional regulator
LNTPCIITLNRLTVLLGHLQAATGQPMTLRKLAARAGVPRQMVYRLDEGVARRIDLDDLTRLCSVLRCTPSDILLWQAEAGLSAAPSEPEQGA